MWTVAAITVATCIKMSRKARFNVFLKKISHACSSVVAYRLTYLLRRPRPNSAAARATVGRRIGPTLFTL